jgi:hypothetical protein
MIRLQVEICSVSRLIQLEIWLLGWATNPPVGYPVTGKSVCLDLICAHLIFRSSLISTLVTPT